MQVTPVILCGGVGTRLWPLSRLHKPKQFLPLIWPNERTLLQNTLERVPSCNPLFTPPILVGRHDHKFLLERQTQAAHCLPQACILEPIPRSTAVSVALAALLLLETNPHALAFFLPADHLIEYPAVLNEKLPLAMKMAQAGFVTIFGQEPLYPETGYGYLEKGALLQDGVYTVSCFKEKPSMELAETFIHSGKYLWNTGMFVAKAGTLVEEMCTFCPAILASAREALKASVREQEMIYVDRTQLEACQENSIDYALMEKTSRGAVIALENLGWCDVGNWSAISQLAQKDTDGNTLMGDVVTYHVKSSYIRAQSRLVCAANVEDMIIVETPDSILVTKKDTMSEIKHIVSRLQNRQELVQHKRVHKPWGYYESLEMGPAYQVKRLVIHPHAAISLQMHTRRSEHWIIVEGEGLITCGDEKKVLKTNESVYIPAQTKHRIENQSSHVSLVLIEVQYGTYLGEDDIVRFEDNYGRVKLFHVEQF